VLDEELRAHPLPPRFVLTAEPALVGERLRAGPRARWLWVSGALPESFLEGLIGVVRRARSPLKVLASDPTRIFLTRHGASFYASAGIELLVLQPIDLLALTVNPVAPQSHEFDSARLRGMLAERIGEVPIFDVLHPSYAGAPPAMARRGGRHALPG